MNNIDLSASINVQKTRILELCNDQCRICKSIGFKGLSKIKTSPSDRHTCTVMHMGTIAINNTMIVTIVRLETFDLKFFKEYLELSVHKLNHSDKFQEFFGDADALLRKNEEFEVT